ncbi:MAG: hypothetical protein R3B99_11095 [Polyangiales bacterium]
MEGLRIPLLACLIAGSMGGVLYAGVKAERSSAAATPTELQPLPAYEALVEPVPEEAEEPELPLGLEAPVEPELTVAIDLGEDAALFPEHEDIELADGVRIGLVFDPEEFFEEELEEAPAPLRRTPRAPSRPPGPRLHSDPGMHSVLTARAMMASGEEIHGSCYAYLSEVYARAGHSSWRKRTIVYRQGRTGPYADLDLIRPGDWLYIVTGPNSTHSVMFVGWSDRARGYARTISHPGWFAGPHTGRESSYDISQTYRIIRPTN